MWSEENVINFVKLDMEAITFQRLAALYMHVIEHTSNIPNNIRLQGKRKQSIRVC